MKKKFDIIKYTALLIKWYENGYSSRNDTIDMLINTFENKSWQLQCENKEIDIRREIEGFDLKGNRQKYYILDAWCREEEENNEKEI